MRPEGRHLTLLRVRVKEECHEQGLWTTGQGASMPATTPVAAAIVH